MKKFLIIILISALLLTTSATIRPIIGPLVTNKTAMQINQQILPLANSLQRTTTEKIPILMYHYIRTYNSKTDPLGVNLSVSPQEFAAQLNELEKLGYQTITFKDLVANRLPTQPIILSFDDGYQDFYSNALPELKKRHMKAVVYIIAGALNTPDYMTKAEVQELAANSIEVGDHTWTHPDLLSLAPTKLQLEITGSKRYLESLIKQPVISFAYPSGKYNDQVLTIVKRAGYRYAVTTHSGEAGLTHSLTLYRFRVGPQTNLAWLFNDQKIAKAK